MKRIAAIITLSVGVIAIPVTAIAATSGSGNSSDKPQAVPTCTDGTVTFDMPPNKSHTFSEVSGPDLYPGEQFTYDATPFTVATVSGAAFTLDVNGVLYRHKGPSVVDGIAIVTCAVTPAAS
jgi:hypothetical protein